MSKKNTRRETLNKSQAMVKPTVMALEANEKIERADTTIVRPTVLEGKDKKQNETEEKSNRKSSSSSISSGIERDSDEGKGSGSGSGSGGHGYNADYSSSDSSSNNDAIALPQKEFTNINMNVCAVGVGVGSNSTQGGEVGNDGCVGKKSADGSKRGGVNTIYSTGMNIAGSPPEERETCQSDVNSSERNFFDDAVWEDVVIPHPMDPRIDLSTVGFMGETSQLYSLQDDLTIENCVSQNLPPTNNNGNQESTSLSFPCVEQEYTKLLEVCTYDILTLIELGTKVIGRKSSNWFEKLHPVLLFSLFRVTYLLQLFLLSLSSCYTIDLLSRIKTQK